MKENTYVIAAGEMESKIYFFTSQNLFVEITTA